MNSAAETVAKIDTHGDTVLEAVKWIVFVLLIIGAALAPVMWYLRKFSSDRAANAKDAAESALYQQLSEQLTSHQSKLDTVVSQYNALVLEHGKALARIAKLEEYEITVVAMRAKLDEKDERLDHKDAELQLERRHNRELTREVMSLKDRIGELEKRLLIDEQQFPSAPKRSNNG